MCVIVAKNKGVDIPEKQILKNCFDNNNDGCGFMFDYKNNVYIKKGFLTFNHFYKTLKKYNKKYNLKNCNLVLHFRIGTSGKNDARTTHPFIISNNDFDLQKLDAKTKLAFCHNGIIGDYVDTTDKLSDTQNFDKKFLYSLYRLNKNFYKYKDIQNIILKSGNNGKFAFLDNKSNLILIGDFIKDNNIYYSNTSYKKSYYSNYTKYNFNNYNYDDYDYNDYDYNYNKYSLDNYYKNYDYYNNDYYDNYDDDDYLKQFDKFKTSDLLFLDDNYYYFSDDDFQQCDVNLVFKDNNLYEIVTFSSDNKFTYCQLIQENVNIYNSDLQLCY